jgi:hypothetical protein
MVKELVEAGKQIQEILEWAEATNEGFATLVNRIQTEVKVHNHQFSTVMILSIIDKFLYDAPGRDKVKERKNGEDEEQETQDAYERVSASWGVRIDD